MVVRQSGTVNQHLRLLFGEGTATGLDDAQLLEWFVVRRDEAAFAALMARYGPLVLGACRRLLSDPADVEDVFQATFLVLFQKARFLKDQRLLGTWLYKVAFRVALRARVEINRRPLLVCEAVSPDPAEDLERHELCAAIDEEILRLPCRYRLPVVLCYLEGLSHEQAARRLGCPLGTVNSRLATARQRLRVRLSKRGLAPSGMLSGTTFLPGMARVVVPACLHKVTLSTVQQVANGSTVAGASSATAVILTEGWLRAMVTSKIKMAAVGIFAASLAVVSFGQLSRGVPGAMPQGGGELTKSPQASNPPAGKPQQAAFDEDETVLVIGTIRMPDGLPAAGATVEAMTERKVPPIITRADDAGRFQLRGVFGNGSQIHAHTSDGKYQALLNVPSAAVRTTFVSPIELTIIPALTHEVTVVSNGRPVEGAHVVSTGPRSEVRDVTGRDGKATLRYPATEQVRSIVAWHRELGVERVEFPDDRPSPNTTRLALRSPSPHTIRVVDPDGKPIGGLEFSPFVRVENYRPISVNQVKEAHVRTDAEGKATLAWMPLQDLKYVGGEILGSDWKIDEVDPKRQSEGITTVHARRRREDGVEGRLIMPEDANAEGLLITGYGFGTGHNGDIPYARARRDGTFTLRVPPDHAYILGIDDAQWASDTWSGVIFGNNTVEPTKITLNIHPATPLTVRVTRGPRHDPLVNAWIDVAKKGNVSWVDAKGEKRSGTAGVRGWIWTNARGEARTGVGKGTHELRLTSGNWSEERQVEVADKPVEIEFHRPWLGERHVAGRMTFDGARYTPSPTLLAHAWTPQPGRFPLEFKPEVRPDGTFEVTFDAENLSMLFHDPQQHRSGFVQIEQQDTPVEPKMLATATYSGILLDEGAQPLADRTLQLLVKTAHFEVSTPQTTDREGHFRFLDVPANLPLQLSIKSEDEKPEYVLFDGDRLFAPAEIRKNDQVKPRRMGSLNPMASPTVPLATRVETICREVRSSGMNALVVLQGDASQNVTRVTGRLLDDDQVKAVLRYRPLRVDAGQLEGETKTLAENGWPKPATGEIVLVALNGDRSTIAAKRIVTDNVNDAVGVGEGFLKRHMPPTRNALAMLTTARKEADKTGRRVWVVLGGPRCGPCFQLGRWMDEHHATLEKDYVIVKVMEGVDEQVSQVIDKLPRKEQSIPWHAIAEPDGTVLATSESPLGNIGFPASVEGVRHFRQMLDRTARRLKSDAVDGLIKSLSP